MLFIAYVAIVVDSFVANQSTVNICALDLSKAFDRVNHFALFMKLMDRLVPAIPYLIFLKLSMVRLSPVLNGAHSS